MKSDLFDRFSLFFIFGRPGGLRRAPLRSGSLPRRNRRGKGTKPFASLAQFTRFIEG